MLYKITEQNIQDGFLSEEDFSRGLGFDVKTFLITDFPHAEELQSRQSLSSDKLSERQREIWRALVQYGLTRNAIDKNSGKMTEFALFNMTDAETMAMSAYMAVTARWQVIELKSGQWDWTKHYALIRKYGFYEAHQKDQLYPAHTSAVGGTTQYNVHPCVLNEVVSVGECFAPYAAVVMVDSGQSSRDSWGQDIRSAPELLENFPTDNMHCLLGQIHEKRHLHQIHTESDSCVVQYYAEMDADLAAITSFSEAGVGKQTLEACQHARYCGILFTPPLYWFAPAMEDIMARKEPDNFFSIHRAVLEIRLRLAANLSDNSKWNISSSDLQNAIIKWDNNPHRRASSDSMTRTIEKLDTDFVNCSREIVGKNPAPLFTGVRQLIEQNVITDPLALRIAHGIISGAYYFNPDFIMADYEPSRRRLQERLGASNFG